LSPFRAEKELDKKLEIRVRVKNLTGGSALTFLDVSDRFVFRFSMGFHFSRPLGLLKQEQAIIKDNGFNINLIFFSKLAPI